MVSNLVTVVRGSCKRQNALRDAQFAKIKEELENGVCRSGQIWIKRQILNFLVIHIGDHIMGLFSTWFLMFYAVVDVIEIIEEDGLSDQKVEVRSIMKSILSFEFVFALHLMKNILGVTNKLSIALPKKKIKI